MTETATKAAPKTPTKSTVPAVYGALLKVTEGLRSIPKNGVLSFGKTSYSYLKADDVQEALNPLLIANGLIVKSQYHVDQIGRGRGETGAAFVNVNLSLTYISTVDGSELTVTSVGESAGSDDKSINKGLTQAIKNSHRAQFQFASGESEPDDIAPRDPATTQAPSAPRTTGPTVGSLKNDISRALGTVDVAEIKAKGDAFFQGREGWANNTDALTKWLTALQSEKAAA